MNPAAPEVGRYTESECLAQVERLAAEENELTELAALRRGSEAAFLTLVTRYHSALIRLAQSHIGDRGIAEELAQETWLVVLRNPEQFKGRSSLKTWIFAILLNCARNRARKEQHTIPFSVAQAARPAVSAEHFRDADDDWPGA
jgi:RNA polymerase sigma-70 factor (ECF subfamily)